MDDDLHISSYDDPSEDTSEPLATEVDPVARWLGFVAGLLVIVVLASTLAFVLYLRSINAPRSAAERDIETFKTAVAEQPLEQSNYLRLAFSYAQAGRYDLASATIERAYELGETPELLYAEAEIHRVAGDYRLAVQTYDEAEAEAVASYEASLRELEKQGIVTTSPNSLLALVLLGRGTAYRGLGDYEAAIADYEAAREITPTDAALHAALGDAYAEAGDADSAVASYREALRFVSDLPAAIEGLRALGEVP